MNSDEKIRRVHIILKNIIYLMDAFDKESKNILLDEDLRFLASLKYENLRASRDSIVRIIEDLI